MTQDFSGETYFVTGVANGIGACLANVLTERGARVIGSDIAEPTCHVDRMIGADLSDAASVQNLIKAIDEPLDGVCNCGGLPPRDGLELPILLVNFTNTVALTHGLLPRVKRDGAVVNIASRAGHGWRDEIEQVKRFMALKADAVAGFVRDESIDPTRAYRLSKEALIVWTQANAEAALNKGIRLNSISPGAIGTRILQDFSDAFGAMVAKNVERTGRAGKPEEVAQLAAFLLSKNSSWIKGTDIPIDGGMGSFALTDQFGLTAEL